MHKLLLSAAFYLVLAMPTSAAEPDLPERPAGEPRVDVVIKPRLGDRYYIESVLNEIFGPDAKELTFKKIFRSAGPFAGPCDIYDQVRVGPEPESFADPRSICPGGKFAASLPMIGTSNVIREGYVMDVCGQLTSRPSTLEFALRALFGGAPARSPDPKTLNVAFQLFYPEKVPSGQVLQALGRIGAQDGDVEKRWAKILFTLCIDPGWQSI